MARGGRVGVRKDGPRPLLDAVQAALYRGSASSGRATWPARWLTFGIFIVKTQSLSANQSKKFSKTIRLPEGWVGPRERRWFVELKADMARAEQYFWRQTPERRKVQREYLRGKTWGNNNFCFS